MNSLRCLNPPQITCLLSPAYLLKLILKKDIEPVKDDPPNAVLSANGFDARIVIIESQTIDNGVMTFTLSSTELTDAALSQKEGESDSEGLVYAVLTIDETQRQLSQGGQSTGGE